MQCNHKNWEQNAKWKSYRRHILKHIRYANKKHVPLEYLRNLLERIWNTLPFFKTIYEPDFLLKLCGKKDDLYIELKTKFKSSKERFLDKMAENRIRKTQTCTFEYDGEIGDMIHKNSIKVRIAKEKRSSGGGEISMNQEIEHDGETKVLPRYFLDEYMLNEIELHKRPIEYIISKINELGKNYLQLNDTRTAIQITASSIPLPSMYATEFTAYIFSKLRERQLSIVSPSCLHYYVLRTFNFRQAEYNDCISDEMMRWCDTMFPGW